MPPNFASKIDASLYNYVAIADTFTTTVAKTSNSINCNSVVVTYSYYCYYCNYNDYFCFKEVIAIVLVSMIATIKSGMY